LKGYTLILSSVVTNFISQIFFKKCGDEIIISKIDFETIVSIYSELTFGIIFYITSAIFWLLGLKKLNLFEAYSFTSLNYILITTYSYLYLNEFSDFNKLYGIPFIILGVILINKQK
jgi:multidrug transporter EmrE-like cation transporter